MSKYTVTFKIDQITAEATVQATSRYSAIKEAATKLKLIPDFPMSFLATVAIVEKVSKKPSGRPRLD